MSEQPKELWVRLDSMLVHCEVLSRPFPAELLASPEVILIGDIPGQLEELRKSAPWPLELFADGYALVAPITDFGPLFFDAPIALTLDAALEEYVIYCATQRDRYADLCSAGIALGLEKEMNRRRHAAAA